MERPTIRKHPLPSPSVHVTKPPVDDSLESDIELEEESEDMNNKLVIGVFVVLIVFGVATGYFLSRGKSSSVSMDGTSVGTQPTKNSVGLNDTKTFKDSATGTIEAGGSDGTNGEGTHKLIREGGPSQTVYLISSAVDLDQFVGKKVVVWGQTMSAKKVAWLMDVGRVDQ